MRRFFVSIVVTVALCIAFLVFVAGIRPSTTGLVILALGLPMLAAVFAAISALGPKFSPTPTLTPIMAWVLAPVLATFMTAGYLKATQDQTSGLHPTDVATVSELVPRGEPEDATLVPDKTVPPPAETASKKSRSASPPLPAAGLSALPQSVTAPLPDTLVSPDIPGSLLFPDAAMPVPDGFVPAQDQALEATAGIRPSDALAVPDASVPASNPSVEASAEATAGIPPSDALAVPDASVPASDPSTEATADVPLAPDRSAEPLVPLVAGTSDTAILTAPPVPRSRPCGGVWPPCAGSTEPVSSTTIW